MDDIMLDLTMKGEKPDLILCGRNMMRLYRAAVRDKVIFALTDTKNGARMADLGFGGVTFNNVPMVYDEDCPVSKMYFINSKFLRLHILRHVNMKIKELAAPWDVDASAAASCGRVSGACGRRTVRTRSSRTETSAAPVVPLPGPHHMERTMTTLKAVTDPGFNPSGSSKIGAIKNAALAFEAVIRENTESVVGSRSH